MEKEALKSGSFVHLSLAPVGQSFKLFQAVVQEFKKNGVELKIDMDTELSFKDIFLKNTTGFINGFADIVTSDKVLECILICAEKCLYEKNGTKQKITMDLFEKEDARGDMFEVLFKIAQRNLKPFFPQALTA